MDFTRMHRSFKYSPADPKQGLAATRHPARRRRHSPPLARDGGSGWRRQPASGNAAGRPARRRGRPGKRYIGVAWRREGVGQALPRRGATGPPSAEALAMVRAYCKTTRVSPQHVPRARRQVKRKPKCAVRRVFMISIMPRFISHSPADDLIYTSGRVAEQRQRGKGTSSHSTELRLYRTARRRRLTHDAPGAPARSRRISDATLWRAVASSRACASSVK